MLNIIKFFKVRKQSLKKLKSEIKMVNQSNKTLAFSNKSSNMKREIKEDNNQLFKNAVISTKKRIITSKQTLNIQGTIFSSISDIRKCVKVNRKKNASLH